MRVRLTNIGLGVRVFHTMHNKTVTVMPGRSEVADLHPRLIEQLEAAESVGGRKDIVRIERLDSGSVPEVPRKNKSERVRAPKLKENETESDGGDDDDKPKSDTKKRASEAEFEKARDIMARLSQFTYEDLLKQMRADFPEETKAKGERPETNDLIDILRSKGRAAD